MKGRRLQEGLEGDLKGGLKGSFKGDFKGDFKGTSRVEPFKPSCSWLPRWLRVQALNMFPAGMS